MNIQSQDAPQGNSLPLFLELVREGPTVSITILLLLLSLAIYYNLSSNRHKKTMTNKSGPGRIGEPSILAIGTANPPHYCTQERFLRMISQNTIISDSMKDFLKARVQNSGIDRRYNFSSDMNGFLATEDNKPTTPEARNAAWREWAPELAVQAAKSAIAKWKGGSIDDITHVVFHSCTGFKAPGVELDLVDQLGLKNVRRRLGINFMVRERAAGCCLVCFIPNLLFFYYQRVVSVVLPQWR